MCWNTVMLEIVAIFLYSGQFFKYCLNTYSISLIHKHMKQLTEQNLYEKL